MTLIILLPIVDFHSVREMHTSTLPAAWTVLPGGGVTKHAECERKHWTPLEAKLWREISRFVFSRHTRGIRREIHAAWKNCHVWTEVCILYVRLGWAWTSRRVIFHAAWISRLVWKGPKSLVNNGNISLLRDPLNLVCIISEICIISKINNEYS